MKQADVVLLGFPLMHPMSAEVRRNDLEMYEPVTDPAGPAMTWVRRGQGPARDWPPGGGVPIQGTLQGWDVPWKCSPWIGGVAEVVLLRCAATSPSPAEHVCRGLAGAEGAAESPEPAGKVLQQHHGALQGGRRGCRPLLLPGG